jgi:predicted SprT family Zn-dependent metalloprotease
MDLHGLHDWVYQYNDRIIKTLGRCIYREKVLEFSLSYVDLNPMEELEDTILHEIAHALAPRAGHGWLWKQVAKRIGARPKSCAIGDIKMPDAPYIFQCPCGTEGKFYRRPKYPKRRCKLCGYSGYVINCSTGKELTY